MKKKLLVACVLGIVLSGLLAASVLAKGGPGVDERSVREPIVSLGSGLDVGISAIYRSGWTNTWANGTWVASQHYSHSDLREERVEVTGRLRMNGQEVSYCHNLGIDSQWATCPTAGAYDPPGTQTWLAESDHYFHTSGYVDSAFSSWQQRYS